MAESISVTGKKISSMELVTNVTGNEKIPTGQTDDLALTPNQIADHTIARGDLASQEDLSQVEVSLGTQITDLEIDVTSANSSIRGLIAAEEAARIAADGDLQAAIDSGDASLQSALDAEVAARIAANNLKVDKEGSVSSVAGRVGDVELAPSDVLVEGFGSQEDVNKYVPKPFLGGYTYGLGERVVLYNGGIVRSTVTENTVDPNLDMNGWFLERSAKNIIDSKGKNLEDFINGAYGDLNVLSVFTKEEYESYLELGENFDATVPVQRAIDKAFDEKKRLFFPVLFNVYETLWLPVDNSFYGQDISKSQTKRFSGIRSRAAVAFKSKPVGPDTMPNTRFDCNRMYLYGNTTNTCLGKVKLQATEISECFIYNWEIFLDGLLGEVSHIHHNRIIAIGSNFITNVDNPNTFTLVDSYVHDNYINARANGTAILINLGSSSHFGIHDNFMDFAYQCIGSNGTPANGAIYGNTFDISYRGIKLNNGIRLSIFGNSFPKNYKAQAANFNLLAGSPNETLLKTTNWLGIEAKSLQYSSIVGNVGESEGLIHIQGYTVRHVRSSANINSLDPSKTVTLLISAGGSVSDDLKGLRFQELEYRTVTSLPTINPSIQTGTYEGDIVRFNDQVLVNNGTKWVGFDGRGLFYKASPSLTLPVIAANELYVSSAQTLTGIKLGDTISVSALTPIDGLQVWAVVTAANQYKIYIKNQSNSATTTGAQSFNVQVRSN